MVIRKIKLLLFIKWCLMEDVSNCRKKLNILIVE